MNNNSEGKRGFTIVEMLLYSGILLIFLLILTDIFVSVLDVRSESEATSSVEQDGRFILMRFMYDIGRAQLVGIPAALGEVSDSLGITIDGSSHTYALNNGDLQLSNATGTNNLNGIGTKISFLSFRLVGDLDEKPTLQVAYTVTSTTVRPSGAETRRFQTTVGLR